MSTHMMHTASDKMVVKVKLGWVGVRVGLGFDCYGGQVSKAVKYQDSK